MPPPTDRLGSRLGVLASTFLGLFACASAELRTEGDDPHLRPWLVESSVDEVVRALAVILEGDPDWRIKDLSPAAGEARLVHYTKRIRFADDVVLKIEPATGGRVLVTARSRSRIGIEDFGQNKRNLKDLVQRLAKYWAEKGVAAEPAPPSGAARS
ncbi:MAG: DUF1499 domain-containing protein [Nitrospirae bacterium]|nr:DUF1499 domain-containing protein [Nitrospirota bacterium]